MIEKVHDCWRIIKSLLHSIVIPDIFQLVFGRVLSDRIIQ